MVTLLTPLALALLALIPPIIALYLLKLRRQDHLVSSIYLWRRFVRDLEANAPWQKLRRNLLLLLQILFMLTLILALARPATQADGVAGQTVLVLDTSASMAATDVNNGSMTRLAAAKAIARDLVTNLPDDARVTIIAAAGGEAEILTSASQDRRQLLDAIAAVEVTALNSDFNSALALAEAIVAREPEAEIALLSDGAVQLPDHLSLPVRFMPVGQSGANQAVSALSVASGPTLFVQVTNYSDQAVQRRLVIQADGAPFTAFDLDLPPGGHAEQIVETLPASAQIIEAYLTPAENDVLSLDDRAWAVLQTAEPVQTTLVTRGNFFLQTALSLLNSRQVGAKVDLTITSPEDWTAEGMGTSSARPNPLTLYIFDAYIPGELPPGNLLFIAPPTSAPDLFEVVGWGANPVPRPAIEDHPLLQNVNLVETQILTTPILSSADWSRIVAVGDTPAGESPPLLLAGEIEGRRVAVLAFSLQQSDLSLRPAFPILVANLVDYLAPGAGGLVPAELAPGDALAISVPPEVNHLRLIKPDGQTTTFEAQARRVNLPPLRQPGLYHLTFEPAGITPSRLDTTQFVVNFFNPLESMITPKPHLTFTGGANQETSVANHPPAHREWWRPLAMGALVLLVGEWLVYQRRAIASIIFRYAPRKRF
jgi:Ca-activated chloride channel family protein